AGAAPGDRGVAEAHTDATPGEVVFTFSSLSWSAAARRGWFGSEDRLALSLVEHERVGRVLVCDRARSLPLKLLRDRLGGPEEAFPQGPNRRLLSPVRARRTDATSLKGVAREFKTYGHAMERGARKMGLEEPVVITTHPLVAGFAELGWARAVTYYALDDWSVHEGYKRWWPAYAAAYKRIRERGHRVAAVSAALLERVGPTGEGLVVPNGLEPAEWLGPIDEETPVNGPHLAKSQESIENLQSVEGVKSAEQAAPAARPIADRDRPVLVYVGTLDERLDVDWLRATARALPHAQIELVGPLVAESHLAPLRDEPNVSIEAPLERAGLAALIRKADVGLIPHRRTALTEAMSPLKLYEYLAGGLPVAATDLAPMRGIDARVTLVEEGGDFAAATLHALALGRAPERERTAFVQSNSWRSRHEALLDLAFA
ncbi:MAG: glycosyltransferase, partial [Solirubrobacteraceae bacterium]